MEKLLCEQPVMMSCDLINCKEECAVSGEFSLPDYCPDIAVILKCVITPYVQHRQWSSEQLLVDILANVRVLYLDEERRIPHAVEFAIPTSCVLGCCKHVDARPVEIGATSKYASGRALGPRKLEVRGSVIVNAYAHDSCEISVLQTGTDMDLCTKSCKATVTYPIGMVEKVFTLNEMIAFPDTLPPAEMLLGGECCAVIRECKLLSGKAIVKGQVYGHQLYMVQSATGECCRLDYVLPFSQILDMDGIEEGITFDASVCLLSDTERCTSGQDGENTVLDVMVKMLIQLQAHQTCDLQLITDAYHTRFPVEKSFEELVCKAHLGCKWESVVLPTKIPFAVGEIKEVLDVFVLNQEWSTTCNKGIATIRGRWQICTLGRDGEGRIVYYENSEEYCFEVGCKGNRADAMISVTEAKYRLIEGCLEVQIGVCLRLEEYMQTIYPVLSELSVNRECPYTKSKGNLTLYYAKSGESVWRIGENCHTPPACICTENALKDETIQSDRVLIVPIGI